MDTNTIMTQLKKLKSKDLDLAQVNHINQFHAAHTIPYVNDIDPIGKAPRSRCMLKCIEELTEFMQALMLYELAISNGNTKAACEDAYISFLEEFADADLTIRSMAMPFEISQIIYEPHSTLVKQYMKDAYERHYSYERIVSDMILCCMRICKQMTKLIAGNHPLTVQEKNNLQTELQNFYFLYECIKLIYEVPEEDIILVECIKRKAFLNRHYGVNSFVPDEILVNGHIIAFSQKTHVNEPSAWIDLTDNTSIEIVYESYDVKEPFFSITRHCSEEDFENETYKETNGVTSTASYQNMLEVQTALETILKDLENNGIHVKD